MKTADSSPRTAYSYIRFSSPQQAEGDSVRRQTDRAAACCSRRGWTLDDTLKADRGVSAFRGKNASQGALRSFLDAIAAGKVKPGSVLIVESVDRISRQGIDEGYDLCKRILKAGISLVTLSPEREYGPESVKGLTKGALELLIILERAAEESQTKSDRCGAACQVARRRARAGGIAFRCLPAWVEIVGDTFRLKPGPAAAVQRIFELAGAGYGVLSIINRLTRDGVPPIGKGGKWVKVYVARILADRRAIGEYQPRLGNGKPEGDPVASYFPPVVTEQEYFAARAGASQRRRSPGRIGENAVYPLAGLLHNARDGDRVYVAQTNPKVAGVRPRVLANARGIAGQAKYESFPLTPFERALFSRLAEIDPRDVIGREDGPDEAAALKGELGALEGREAELEAELLSGDVPAIAKALRALGERKQDVKARLEAARQRAAVPLAVAWSEAQSLLAALDSAPDPDDARLRLRATLRRVVSEIWLLMVPRGKDRLCAVQVWFADGERCRSYLIWNRQPVANAASRKDGILRTWSLAEVAHTDLFDLRRPQDAAGLEAELLTLDLAALGLSASREAQ